MVEKPEKTTSPNGEVDLIRRIRSLAGLRGPGLRLGIGDDCALLRADPGEEIAVTTDLSIDGRHFRLGWHPPESVGHRTLARGLSDLAAMGARPLAAFVSLGIPRELTVYPGRQKRPQKRLQESRQQSWLDRFYAGFLALAAEYKTSLAGGDLSESPVALADVVMVGAVPRGRALLRSGARFGDLLYVTGELGGASAGLAQLEALAAKQPGSGSMVRNPKKQAPVLQPHLYPQPRVTQGLWLQRRGIASAALDISDGLSTDLAHICEESQVAAEVDAASLPIAPGATFRQALTGGEDYELLFTARSSVKVPRAIAGIPITRIGRIVRPRPGAPQVLLRTAAGFQPLEPRGWEHFLPK